MDSSCANTPSNGLSDRTAHGLVSSNQRASRRDVIMARQKPPASSYYRTYPFKFTNSHNSVNTNSIKVHSSLTTGKSVLVTIILVRSFYIKNLQSRDQKREITYRVESHTSVLKRTEYVHPVLSIGDRLLRN